MTLRDGRAFTDGDTAASEPVAIVNESFARQILHDANPVGRLLGNGKTVIRIVGVSNDVQAKPGLDDTGPISTERTLYIPATQVDSKFLTLIHVWFQPNWIIRSTQLDAHTPAAMQRALASVDPNLPFASFHTMDELLASALALQRIEVALLSSLAVLALLLAGLGIFALVSSVITDRQREFGIRIALGSPISDAMLVAGRSGILPAAIGLVSGLALRDDCAARDARGTLRRFQLRPVHFDRHSCRAFGAGRARQPAACIAHHADSTSGRFAC